MVTSSSLLNALFDLHMRLSLAIVDQPNGNNLVMSKPMWQGWI